MKKIIITGGPTNEYIDEVMKITNMSTGSLAVALGEEFQKAGFKTCLILNNAVYAKPLEGLDNIKIFRVETTEEMLNTLEDLSKKDSWDGVIHAAAVGDYKGGFSFLMEHLAKEIYEKKDSLITEEDFLELLLNPDCKLDDSSKISSYQKNLTVKLALTPKIIARLREWYPDSLLIGCKLLENVPKEELYDVAKKLAKKNKMDYILANDLLDLRNGKIERYPITNSGYIGTPLYTPREIFEFVNEKI